MRVTPSVTSQFAAKAFKSACMAELEALKPGNVHIFSDGHGMVVQDFLHSAEASASVIARDGLNVGERIWHSIDATRKVVAHNTNLGIILLSAPLVHAYLEGKSHLRDDLQSILASLTISDAALAFKAIVLASPAGLGKDVTHDVNDEPRVTLFEAMCAASQRDMIAKQYANSFAEIFHGADIYKALLERWERQAWATTGVYLHFLAEFPDTHIVRKYGETVAIEVRDRAVRLNERFHGLDNPKLCQRELLDFDAELKSRGLNPGTSADLTVAVLLAYLLLSASSSGRSP